MRETIPNDPAPAPVFAIVEQLGHRRFGARVEEFEFCGTKALRCVVLAPEPRTTVVMAASLFAVTFCSEAEARRANLHHTGVPLLGAGTFAEDQGGDEDDEGDDDHPVGNPCCGCGAEPGEDCAPDCEVGVRHTSEV